MSSLAGIAATGAFGPATARGNGRRQGASAPNTLYEIVAGSDDFDMLAAALEETGLDAVLDAESDQYTVFAPTNTAFGQLLADLGITASDLLEDPDLPTILKYHVTTGRRYAPSIVNSADVEMLAGGTVATNGTTLNGGQAQIVTTDVEASNGVAHVIDGVLLP